MATDSKNAAPPSDSTLEGGSYEVLRPPMSEFFGRLATHAPELGLRPLSNEQVEALADFVIAALPGATTQL